MQPFTKMKNKYLEIERKNQLNLFPELQPKLKPTLQPKKSKKKPTRKGEPVDFTNQQRRCEMYGCSELANTLIAGPLGDTHYYCNEHMRQLNEKDQEGNLAEAPPNLRPEGSDCEGAPI